VLALASLLLGCDQSNSPPEQPQCAAANASTCGSDGATSKSLPDQPLCAAPSGISGAPASIDDVITLANAMLARQPQEEGLTLPCFVESLARPLTALASSGMFSAQPAVGARSPRIFVFSENLVMSVAPEGLGAERLEVAEYTTPTRSIKGEIAFPIRAPITSTAPYERILYPGGPGTVCAACHSPEEELTDGTVSHRFESDVLRPRADEEVSLPFLEDQMTVCDSQKEPARCQMLTAVFGHGVVNPGHFSAMARTIYGD
jgi:hypothetical protein